MIKVLVKKLKPSVKLPSYKTDGASGMDLMAYIDKAIELTTTKTIQFAKRQKTWFRNKNNPLWLNNKNLLKDAIIKIESFLD